MSSSGSRVLGKATKWIVLAALLIGLLVASALGVDWWTDRSYVGTSKRVTLTWTCWNLIFWRGNEFQWWAGQSPHPAGNLETRPRGSVHYAAGRLRFATLRTATFTSDAGGRLTMRRESLHAPHTMECAVQQP